MEAGANLDAFFHDAVGTALRERRVAANGLTEHYLARLLASFATQPPNDGPLGVRLLEALDETPRERRERLREIGDTSLYMSGFFSERLERGGVSVGYYMDVGESAYGQLASVGEGWSRDPFGDVYGALARDFERFVVVLGDVSLRLMQPAEIAPAAPEQIVRLYERWARTRSPLVARRLAALGVTVWSADPGDRPQ